MQLAVSQVVGESTTSDEALPAMLESLGTNLGFDMAGLWFVSSDHHTRYLAGWYAPDRACAEFHRDSIGRVLQKGKDLPGQIWAAESPCWIENLQESGNFLRRTVCPGGRAGHRPGEFPSASATRSSPWSSSSAARSNGKIVK
jgi:hypothetical protein